MSADTRIKTLLEQDPSFDNPVLVPKNRSGILYVLLPTKAFVSHPG